jgi:hypothetical protein
VCTSKAFQTVAGACLAANCTVADDESAIALQQEECAAITSVSSGATQTTTTPASTSRGTQTTATSVSTKASTPFSPFNAALGGAEQFAFAAMVSAVVCALVGGVLAL